ncbi:MAG: lysyl oxidase family protein [Actinomycetota bacterium]
MRSGRTVAVLPFLLIAPMLLGVVAAPAHAATGSPSLRVLAATPHVTVVRPRHRVAFVDPGFFVSPVGGTFELKLNRATLADPVRLTQVWTDGTGEHTRILPRTLLRGWNGLKDFFHVAVRNSAGRVVRRMTTDFCPNSQSPQRVKPTGPAEPSFPAFCGRTFSPFLLGSLWGIDHGWAVNPLSPGGSFFFGPGGFFGGGLRLRLPAGTYRVQFEIRRSYARLFGVDPDQRTATIKLTLENGKSSCCFGAPAGSADGTARGAGGWSRLPDVADSSPPDPQYLPDLEATPAFDIRAQHARGGHDILAFASTEWVGGGSDLDVQGFRRHNSDVMDAYQYFFRDGQVVGRAPVGTLLFDDRPGHHHWHFQQFARYRLLDSTQSLVVRSHKQSFCIAPSDPIDTTIPGATARPDFFGFLNACGTPTSLWVHEKMSLGWGDTYLQYVAGQAFDITDVPNGTYYVSIEVNPEHLLYEQSEANDATLRRVILRGTPGHRTACVPAVDGIDAEGNC